MKRQRAQALARWSMRNQHLRERKVYHEGMGLLTIKDVRRREVLVEGSGYSVPLSQDFLEENIVRLLSKRDISELERIWLKDERKREIEAARKLQRARKQAQSRRVRVIRALEEASKRLKSIREFISCTIEALSDPLPVDLPKVVPNTDDWKLIRLWMQTDGSEVRESERRRLMSARLAEKAVAKFYEENNHEVVDASLTQLYPAGDQDWRIFDLDVAGKLLDIKNARRSFKSPERYSDHCVARFKQHRKMGTVAIGGVLSHWLSIDEMISREKSALFLGITTGDDIHELCRVFSEGQLVVAFSDSTVPKKLLLPPWIFEYPPDFYERRTFGLEQLKALPFPDWRLCRDAQLNPIPGFLAIRRDYRFDPQFPFTEAQKPLLRRLEMKIHRLGLKMPVIFLTVLEHFVAEMTQPSGCGFKAGDYMAVMFPTRDRTRPLFLSDPLRVIETLLENLSVLWAHRSMGLRDFRIFRLDGFNILRAKKASGDSQWKTLLAYCGGWIQEPTVRPCGTTPLVFGECKSCNDCGRLICPNCGYCSEPCRGGRRFG